MTYWSKNFFMEEEQLKKDHAKLRSEYMYQQRKSKDSSKKDYMIIKEDI